MKIAIIGASGLVGSAVVPFLLQQRHEVITFKRQEGKYHFQSSDFEGVDAVINLAGESLAKRWTKAAKKEIKASRVATTKALQEALLSMQIPPQVVINASAIGYYGTSPDRTFDENSPPGRDFLAEVVTEWENALKLPKTRVVFARFGMIISAKGGALKQMLTPFKLGLGGIIGSGNQYMSWIDIDDVVSVLYQLLIDPKIAGPVNVVSPYPVTNREFTKTLGKVLKRPTWIPMPEFLVHLLFGEMGDLLLLGSSRVEPKVLNKAGYRFRYPDLESALKKES